MFSLQAAAQEAAGGSPAQGLLVNLPFIIILVALFYFAVISPQKKQQKQHLQFLSELKSGDEVVTASGIIGVVQGLTEKVVTLEISPDVEVKVLRSQVQSRLKALLETQKKG
ncbi:preprotein translocase subunit YajC [bacterium]|nr:preprotein translocase subunit YajC [bacterium]